jgi:hypothetical protein
MCATLSRSPSSITKDSPTNTRSITGMLFIPVPKNLLKRPILHSPCYEGELIRIKGTYDLLRPCYDISHHGAEMLFEERACWNEKINSVTAVNSAVILGLIAFFFNSFFQVLNSSLSELNIITLESLYVLNAYISCSDLVTIYRIMALKCCLKKALVGRNRLTALLRLNLRSFQD